MVLMVFLPQVAISASLDYDQFQEEKIFKGKPAEPNLEKKKGTVLFY
jgi:hypothetical protein